MLPVQRGFSPCEAFKGETKSTLTQETSPMTAPRIHNPRFVSRRNFLFEAGSGISGLALLHLLNEDGLLAAEPADAASACASPQGFSGSPYLPKPPHFKPRAKSVISLFMSGGVSHIDTFDYKPALS